MPTFLALPCALKPAGKPKAGGRLPLTDPIWHLLPDLVHLRAYVACFLPAPPSLLPTFINIMGGGQISQVLRVTLHKRTRYFSLLVMPTKAGTAVSNGEAFLTKSRELISSQTEALLLNVQL